MNLFTYDGCNNIDWHTADRKKYKKNREGKKDREREREREKEKDGEKERKEQKEQQFQGGKRWKIFRRKGQEYNLKKIYPIKKINVLIGWSSDDFDWTWVNWNK